METLFGRDNAQMGFNRFRRTRGTSTTSILGKVIAHKEKEGKYYNEYHGTEGALLEIETASYDLKFFRRFTPRTLQLITFVDFVLSDSRLGHASCSNRRRCCLIQDVYIGRFKSVWRSCHYKLRNFIYNRNGRMYKFSLHHHF